VPSAFEALLASPGFKSLIPLPIIAALAPVIFWFFRDTWKMMDREAASHRIELADEGKFDTRPLVCLVVTALVLTLQEYYGGRYLFEEVIGPAMQRAEQHGLRFLKFDRYDELYGFAWWVLARVIGYVLIPFPLWKLLYPKDSLLDLGLRTRGFLRHAWIYGLCLAVVIPTMLLVSTQPDFGTYYPFYKQSSRSWFDFLAWESMYYVQFLALELFFRGFIVGTLRKSLGAASIFVMAVPYCMIHYGKPYLEANGAIVAGVVLGSLAAKTKSIYSGFLVHVTVAALMDILSLWHRHALPTQLWPIG
jgi:membrane protease YdiL (CAAX protease family)